MKINYLLKKKGKGHLIYVALYHDSLTELISTGQKCLPKDWNKKDGKPSKQDTPLYRDIEKVRTAVDDVHQTMIFLKEPVTSWTLKQKYKASLKQSVEQQRQHDKKDKDDSVTVVSCLATYLEEGMGAFKKDTKKSVKHSLGIFETFLKTKGFSKLEKKELTLSIINKYASYLFDTMDYSDGTHGRCMKHLTWFLKSVGFDKNFVEQIIVRSLKPGEGNVIHLTEEELLALEQVDVSYNDILQRGKDMFLLGCYLGLRISDLMLIRKHHIVNNSLAITQKKNVTPVYIPLLRKTRAILERYDYNAPRIDKFECNKSIKTVCAKAGINTEIGYKRTKEGETKTTVHPKHEKITMHCAGKTFISLADKLYKLTVVEVAAIVGKDVNTVLRYYLKANVEAARNKMIESETPQMQIAV
jgi:integrase